MAIGPLAENAIYRARVKNLEQELTDLQHGYCRREREAFDSGVQHGRAAWPIGLLMGAMAGSALTGLYFVLVG